MSALHITGQTL